jgi:hypothetical protein
MIMKSFSTLQGRKLFVIMKIQQVSSRAGGMRGW